MPRRCSVYGCRSNYAGQKDRVTTFSMPKDKVLRQRWLCKIRTDFTNVKQPFVCIKHFEESLIIRTDVLHVKGVRKEYPRDKLKLCDGAVPTIFPSLPDFSQPASTLSQIVKVKEDLSDQETVMNSFSDQEAATDSFSDQEAVTNSLSDNAPYMPRICSVPGCRAYKTKETHIAVFGFPKEESLRNKWIASIKRKNFVPSQFSGVCISHFNESVIIREDPIKRPDGTTFAIVQRNEPALKEDSYPTIFPDRLADAEEKLKQRKLQLKCENKKAKDEEAYKQFCHENIIPSLAELKEKVKEKIKPAWLYLCREKFVLIYKIETKGCPRIVVSFKIFKDLTVEIFHNNMSVDINIFTFMLGKEHECDTWTKLESLQNLLDLFETNDVTAGLCTGSC